MDIGFWSCLCQEDSGLHLRQRIPEVCVFRGCRLDAWYHAHGGLLTRKRQGAAIENVLKQFLSAAAARPDVQVDSADEVLRDTAVAILRKPSPLVDGKHSMPFAIVLTVGDLEALLRRVSNGVEEADTWSLQTIVEPGEDVRNISVYSCDAMGEERGEIFGRRFRTVYPIDGVVNIPSPEEVAADRCLSVTPARRMILEAKTLAIVRFASRFHGIDFEGMVLEFVFDGHNHAVLHGCWASSRFGNEPRRRPTDNEASNNHPVRAEFKARAFPVPHVGQAETLGTAAPGQRQTPEQDEPEHNVGHAGLGALQAELEKRRSVDEAGRCVSPGRGKTLQEVVRETSLLLEIWSGEEFLGEADILLEGKEAEQQHTLQLRTVGEGGAETREDERKEPLRRASGKVQVTVACVREGDGHALLQFKLERANGLHSELGSTMLRPRALLWLRTPGAQFAPIWASKEVRNAANPDWSEVVSLNVLGGEQRPRAPPGVPRALSRGAPSARPCSAQARLETGWTEGASGLGPGARACRAASPSVTGQRAERVTVGLKTSVTSAHEPVCGAPFCTHWGVSKVDGGMETHVLAEQVLRRFSFGRLNRSTMLPQLAGNLLLYHDMQLSWETQIREAVVAIEEADQHIAERAHQSDALHAETQVLKEKLKAELGAECRSLLAELDDYRVAGTEQENLTAQSEKRIQEQHAHVKRLEVKNKALENSFCKTMQKFDEITTEYQAIQAQHGVTADSQATAHAVRQARAADNVLERAQLMANEVAKGEEALRREIDGGACLRITLEAEQAHHEKLKAFIKSVAHGPSTTVRCGGGFVLDNHAKREAASLMKEFEKYEFNERQERMASEEHFQKGGVKAHVSFAT